MNKDKGEKRKDKTGSRETIPRRDDHGVRINNYDKTMKQFKRDKAKEIVDNTENEMLINMIDNIDGVIKSGDGAEVVTGRGRPPKYENPDLLVDKYKEYLLYIYDCNTNKECSLIPDIEGFCSFAHISRSTLFEWENTRSADYSNVIKWIRNDIAAYKKQLGLKGKIPALVMAMDFNNNHGYVQNQKIDVETHINVTNIPSIDDINKYLP